MPTAHTAIFPFAIFRLNSLPCPVSLSVIRPLSAPDIHGKTGDNEMIQRTIQFLSTLGPGLLYAGAAVGVSHLVMSTQAGAMYQFLFLLLIPLIHVVKYPFFKYGPQYTALTAYLSPAPSPFTSWACKFRQRTCRMSPP